MTEQMPLAVAVIISLLMVVSAVVVVLVTVRAATGRLGVNTLAGIRVSATMRDESAWQAGHAAALGATRTGAVGIALAAVLALPLRDPAAYCAVVIAGAAWVLVWMGIGVRRAVAAATVAPPSTGSLGSQPRRRPQP